MPTDEQCACNDDAGHVDADELAQLGKSKGREFDRLFLAFMIGHHEGALQMVQELFKSPGAAQDSDIFRFATDVEVDQRDEIYVMQQMLDTIREDALHEGSCTRRYWLRAQSQPTYCLQPAAQVARHQADRLRRYRYRRRRTQSRP